MCIYIYIHIYICIIYIYSIFYCHSMPNIEISSFPPSPCRWHLPPPCDKNNRLKEKKKGPADADSNAQ